MGIGQEMRRSNPDSVGLDGMLSRVCTAASFAGHADFVVHVGADVDSVSRVAPWRTSSLPYSQELSLGRVLKSSSVGSQTKSFLFNAPLRKHAVCRVVPKRRPKSKFTRPYPNFLILIPKGTPSFPPVLRKCSAHEQARPLRRSPDMVGRAVSPRPGATWDKCALGGGHFRLRQFAVVEAGRERNPAPSRHVRPRCARGAHHDQCCYPCPGRALGPNVANRKRRSSRADSGCAGRRG